MSLGYVARKSWTTEERKAAKNIFQDNITSRKSPSLEKCKEILKNCYELQSRTPAQIKAWVNNHIKKTHQEIHMKGYYLAFFQLC